MEFYIFVYRSSRYKFLLITNLTHYFIYLFISSLYMFRASQCSSSGDRIVLIHHLVWLVRLTAWYAGQAYQAVTFFSFLSPGATQPIMGVYFTTVYRALASSRTRLLDHTQRRATVGRTPLNEWSVRRRDLYLTTHNTHNRQTSMPRVGFEPTIAAGQRS